MRPIYAISEDIVSSLKGNLYPGRNHTSPIGLSDRVKTSDLLPARVIFDEADIARDIDLPLFLLHLSFLFGDRLGAIATTVTHGMFGLAKECWVAVEIHSAILGLVPLGIQQEILCI